MFEDIHECIAELKNVEVKYQNKNDRKSESKVKNEIPKIHTRTRVVEKVDSNKGENKVI